MSDIDKEKAMAYLDRVFDDSVPVGEEELKLIETLYKESDRGCVLVGASLLDEKLEDLLRSHFSQDEDILKNGVKPLFKGNNAPLGSFWAKSNMALSLELISKETHAALNKIGDIRNLFAHSTAPASLTEERVIPILQYFEVYMQKLVTAFQVTSRQYFDEIDHENRDKDETYFLLKNLHDSK